MMIGGVIFDSPTIIDATPLRYAALQDGRRERQGIKSSMRLCGWPSRTERDVDSIQSAGSAPDNS